MNQQPEKALLNLEEFCSYLGIGKTKARELLKDPSSTFMRKNLAMIRDGIVITNIYLCGFSGVFSLRKTSQF